MTKMKVKPGRWLYAIGVLLIVAGIIVAGATAVNGAMSAMKDSIKMQAPGKSTVQLEKTGAYTMTYAASSDGKPVTDTAAYQGLSFQLTDADGGSVSVKSVSGTVMTFTVSKPGAYTMDAEYSGGSGPSATLMLMPTSGINGALISGIFWAFLIIGVALIVVTAVLRRKNRRKMLVGNGNQ
ncbi:MAG: hypothetical protein GX424_00530 [Clostridiales bacterium]|nr:hypothetical protein [Clostridiales bacterium]